MQTMQAMQQMRRELKKWMLNDYFTPSFRAEVVWDTLLTPYVGEILHKQCGLDAAFVTKEMSIYNEDRKSNQGERIDYILADEGCVYLVELKTTDGSILSEQAERYMNHCQDKTFGAVFGQQLLNILSSDDFFKRKLQEHNADIAACLDSSAKDACFKRFFNGVCGDTTKNYAKRAKNLLQREKKTSTHKYLYTLGQLLDYLHDFPDRGLWDLPLKLLYITPTGCEPDSGLMGEACKDFYVHPDGRGSVSLLAAAEDLSRGDELARLLAEVIRELYGGQYAPKLIIHRGANQIGGCCTELLCGDERILFDLGANLPDCDSIISDDELVKRVFEDWDADVDALLFSHPHGDHYGLYKKVPEDVSMYTGPLAKEILEILVEQLDHVQEEKGAPIVKRMETYRDGQKIGISSHFAITPLRTDHSAPDAYMFYIETAGKRILFTGDFRDHGVAGEDGGVWKALEAVPEGIDLLITEGTMLSRTGEARHNPVQSEAELGKKAGELFESKKRNFVLVSSTNLDSIMEFYQNTPKGRHFVCDAYQAKLMLAAMADMQEKFAAYRPSATHRTIRILWRKAAEREALCRELSERARQLGVGLEFQPADSTEFLRDGFVMLVRKTILKDRKTVFQTMLDSFWSRDAQIIYSMWRGYLPEGSHPDAQLASFLGGRKPVCLHTSGHAYVDTIAQLIERTEPKVIIPIHTECAQQFRDFPEFARWRGRVHPLEDGEVFDLSDLEG